jgi:hypothetical protein
MDPAGSVRDRATRVWPWLAGVGAVCGLVPVALALSGAFQIQLIAAAAGALLTTCGFGLARAAWPGWARSDVGRLLLSLGFFACCAGVVLMLAGVGIYH